VEGVVSEPVEDVKRAAGTKLGPLPVGVWAAAILAGIGVAVIVRRNSGGTTAAVVVDEPAGLDVGGVPPQQYGGGQPGMPYGGDGTPAPTNPQRPATNDEWRDLAAVLLIARGYNPLTVVNALGKYLEGVQLDAQEQAIVTAAIAAAGPPPQGAPPVTLIPLPTPGQQPAPAPEPGPAPGTAPAPVAPAPAPTPVPTQYGDNGWTPIVGGVAGLAPALPGNYWAIAPDGTTTQVLDTPANRAYNASLGWGAA